MNELQTDQNLYEKILTVPQLSQFAMALKRTFNRSLISESMPFTLLAPLNRAFRGLKKMPHLDLKQAELIIKSSMRYHIIPGAHTLEELLRGRSVVTLSGEVVSFYPIKDEIWAADSMVLKRNLKASNGYIHIIDKVLTTRQIDAGFRCGDDLELAS